MSRHLASRRVVRGSAVVALSGVALVATTGVGLAHFRSTGAGTGSASTGTITLTATAAVGAGLFPGGSVPVTVNIVNTSATALVVKTITAASFSVTTQGKAPGCEASVVSFAAGALGSTPLVGGANADYPGTVAMTTAAADACQGATFTATLTVTGQAG